MFDELTGLKSIWQAIEGADNMVKAYLSGTSDQAKASEVAIAALRHPMKGFQGVIEGMIFDIDPSALEDE